MDKNGSLFAQKWMKTIKAIIGRLLVLPFVKKSIKSFVSSSSPLCFEQLFV